MERALAKWLSSVLENGAMTTASCPKKHRTEIEQYIHREILVTSKTRGREYVSIGNETVVRALIAPYEIKEDPLLSARANAVMIHKDSKAGKSLDFSLLLFRSAHPDAKILVNGKPLDIYEATSVSGALSVFSSDGSIPQLEFGIPLYLIENLACWAEAEKYLPVNGTYLFYQGWLSSKLLSQMSTWKTPGLHISPDYDLVGLHNWIKLKSAFPEAQLFFPENFAELLLKFPAAHLWIKQNNYHRAVAELCHQSNDQVVKNWLSRMQESGACLEQEALLIC